MGMVEVHGFDQSVIRAGHYPGSRVWRQLCDSNTGHIGESGDFPLTTASGLGFYV